MGKKKAIYGESKRWYLEKKKQYFKGILIYSIFFIPLLLAQIGILVLDIMFFDTALYQSWVLLIFMGHVLFLVIFLPFTAMWLFNVLKYRSTRKILAEFGTSPTNRENANTCPKCGAPVVTETKFCTTCGALLN